MDGLEEGWRLWHAAKSHRQPCRDVKERRDGWFWGPEAELTPSPRPH